MSCAYFSRRGSRRVLVLLVPLSALLVGCPPPAAGPPTAPVIIAGTINAKLATPVGSNPVRVTIGTIPWQTTNAASPGTFTWGWLEDVLVDNPYSFQLRINHNLASSALSVTDVNGTPLVSIAPRSNQPHACSGPTGPVAGSECYFSPGNAGYVPPVAVPGNHAVYSVELATTCDDVLTPASSDYGVPDRTAHCAAGQTTGSALLLTISPAREVFAGTNGQFVLVAKNAAGTASTPFDVALPYGVPWMPFIPKASVGSSPGGPNMPPAPAACPGGAPMQSISFQLECTKGGVKSSIDVAGSGCSHAEARDSLLKIYQLETTPTGTQPAECTLSP